MRIFQHVKKECISPEEFKVGTRTYRECIVEEKNPIGMFVHQYTKSSINHWNKISSTKKRFYQGESDDELTYETKEALISYQRKFRLPQGNFNLMTLRHL